MGRDPGVNGLFFCAFKTTLSRLCARCRHSTRHREYPLRSGSGRPTRVYKPRQPVRSKPSANAANHFHPVNGLRNGVGNWVERRLLMLRTDAEVLLTQDYGAVLQAIPPQFPAQKRDTLDRLPVPELLSQKLIF